MYLLMVLCTVVQSHIPPNNSAIMDELVTNRQPAEQWHEAYVQIPTKNGQLTTESSFCHSQLSPLT